MERFNELLGKALPWVLLVLLIVFTLVVASNLVGMYKAKKADPTLRLALTPFGKVVMGLLYGAYLMILLGTIVMEVQILTNPNLGGTDKMNLALNALNALTIVTFIAGLEFQDIFFIGEKNIYIASRMYEIRRMRKMNFPKKHKMVFIYGQKEYSFSTRFVDVQLLKSKFARNLR